MRKTIVATLLALSTFAFQALGQVSISASSVTDSFGRPVSLAKLCFTPTDATKTPIGFRYGSTQVVPNETCGTVTNGLFESGVHLQPSPIGAFYHIYLKQGFSNTILRDFGMVPVTGATWTLDTYDPSDATAPIGSITVGTVSMLSPGSGGSCGLVGSGPYVLNCSIPLGATGPPGADGLSAGVACPTGYITGSICSPTLSYNAAWYGFGPSVSASANTANINACGTAAWNGGGATCHIPHGVYNFNGPIYLRQAVPLTGDGVDTTDGTQLVYQGTGGCLLQTVTTDDNPAYAIDITAIAFQGNNTNEWALCSDAATPVDSTPPQFLHIYNVLFGGMTNGFKFTAISYFKVEHNNLFGARTAFTANTTSGSPTITFSGTPAIYPGEIIKGTGISNGNGGGSSIVSVGSGTATLSLNATASGSASLVAGGTALAFVGTTNVQYNELSVFRDNSIQNWGKCMYFTLGGPFLFDNNDTTDCGSTDIINANGPLYFDHVHSEGNPFPFVLEPNSDGGQAIPEFTLRDANIIMPGLDAAETAIYSIGYTLSGAHLDGVRISKQGSTVPTASITLTGARPQPGDGTFGFTNILDLTGGQWVLPENYDGLTVTLSSPVTMTSGGTYYPGVTTGTLAQGVWYVDADITLETSDPGGSGSPTTGNPEFTCALADGPPTTGGTRVFRAVPATTNVPAAAMHQIVPVHLHARVVEQAPAAITAYCTSNYPNQIIFNNVQYGSFVPLASSITANR